MNRPPTVAEQMHEASVKLIRCLDRKTRKTVRLMPVDPYTELVRTLGHPDFEVCWKAQAAHGEWEAGTPNLVQQAAFEGWAAKAFRQVNV